MQRLRTAINKQRETAWREYKRTRNIDVLLTTLESLDKVERVIAEANEYHERVSQRIALAV